MVLDATSLEVCECYILILIAVFFSFGVIALEVISFRTFCLKIFHPALLIKDISFEIILFGFFSFEVILAFHSDVLFYFTLQINI